MQSSAHEHVRLRVADASRPGWEELPARQLQGGEWLLLASPLYALGVAAGDVVRASREGGGDFYVIRRGGNVCVQFYLAAESADDEAETHRVAERIRDLIAPAAGTIDGITRGLVTCTIPVAAGFPAIEGAFDQAAGMCPGAQWQFGNVFDFETGQPLNWWRRTSR